MWLARRSFDAGEAGDGASAAIDEALADVLPDEDDEALGSASGAAFLFRGCGAARSGGCAIAETRGERDGVPPYA